MSDEEGASIADGTWTHRQRRLLSLKKRQHAPEKTKLSSGCCDGRSIRQSGLDFLGLFVALEFEPEFVSHSTGADFRDELFVIANRLSIDGLDQISRLYPGFCGGSILHHLCEAHTTIRIRAQDAEIRAAATGGTAASTCGGRSIVGILAASARA